jgi:hypothetical protein
VYFADIVTVQTYVLKSNYIFWKPVKFPIILYIYIFICTIKSKNKSRVMNTPLLPHSQILDAIIIISYSFWIFFNFKNTFRKKQITYSDRAWNSLSSCIFIYFLTSVYWKKFEYSEHTLNLQIRKIYVFRCFWSFLFQFIIPIKKFFFKSNYIFW